MNTAKEFFAKNGGIKTKADREMVMMLDSEDLAGTGFYMKVGKRGHLTIQQAPYIKEFRRTVRLSYTRKREQS